jgi:hypothetical protein
MLCHPSLTISTKINDIKDKDEMVSPENGTTTNIIKDSSYLRINTM